MEFTVEDGDNKAQVKVGENGMVLLQFYWRGSPAKSKKGNLNMAWCSEMLWQKIIKAYQEGGSPQEEDDDSPF
jgi:hypothetical protein